MSQKVLLAEAARAARRAIVDVDEFGAVAQIRKWRAGRALSDAQVRFAVEEHDLR